MRVLRDFEISGTPVDACYKIIEVQGLRGVL